MKNDNINRAKKKEEDDCYLNRDHDPHEMHMMNTCTACNYV